MDKKILSFYTEAEISNLKKIQEQNKFINENKQVFFSACNKILDFLYDHIDQDEKINPTVQDAAKEYEMIRKKVHNDASLSTSEIAMLLNAIQYIATDMKRLSDAYAYSSQELENYIKTLTFNEK